MLLRPMPPMPTQAMFSRSLGGVKPRPSTCLGTMAIAAPVAAAVSMNSLRDTPSLIRSITPPFGAVMIYLPGMSKLTLIALSFAIVPALVPAARPDVKAGPWRTLFDGTSLDAWKGYQTATIPDGWKIVDRALAKDTPVADIVSKDQFGNFELQIDWKIGPAGNSGIFYRGTEEYEHIYWSAPEYQLLDDIKGADNKTRLTCAGAAYAVYPSPAGHLKPVGQWNQARIVANGAHIEHWLNGVKLLEYEMRSPDWERRVKASKFAEWPNYGRAKRGHIAMQGDHSGTLAFRNIRVREI